VIQAGSPSCLITSSQPPGANPVAAGNRAEGRTKPLREKIMLTKSTALKICTMAIMLSVAGIATAGEMVKDGSGHPVMGVTQPMMADKMDKMEKKPMMDDKMDKKTMMDDKMEKKPMMDDKMKK
jgi:hypothetical protein